VRKDALKRAVSLPDTGPPGPDKQGRRGKSLRRIFFVVIVLYVLLAAFHVQILTAIGRMLVVAHAASSSDVIVCLSGGNIERALGAADVYHKGLALRVFISPERMPDGYDVLKSRGIQYPLTVDLLFKLLLDLGVPQSSIVVGGRISNSTMGEAEIVRAFVEKEKIHSLVVVTSPPHTRRSYLTFTKVLQDLDVRVQVVPTPYSSFRPEDWWKHRKHLREVVTEYQKLAYYYLREF